MTHTNNPTDANQASEDELRAIVSDILANLMIKSSLQKLDKHTDLITSGKKYIAMHNEELNTILALIRTEKLKLLEEVRERVVGEDILAYDTPDITPHLLDLMECQNQLRVEQRAELDKLEAEL